MLKVYEYAKCSTCVKAVKFLESRKIAFQKIPIVEKPPTLQEIKKMYEVIKSEGGTLRNMFNTSGLVYKEMNLSQKLADMSEAESLKLLASNGKLVKRPFVIGDETFLLGFKEEVWKKTL